MDVEAPNIGASARPPTPPLESSLPEDEEPATPPPEKVPLITRKVRLFPTPAQQRILDKWFGAARWTYNACVAALQARRCSPNKCAFRAHCINKGAPQLEGHDWALEVPFDVRDEAMADLVKARKAHAAKERVQKKTLPATYKFRSKRRDPQQCITIRRRHWGRGRGAYAALFGVTREGGLRMRAAEELPLEMDNDLRITRDQLGHVYVCYCVPRPTHPPVPGNRVISLDPGVRTFLTGYDPDGRLVEIGSGDITRVVRLLVQADKVQSKEKDKKHRSRRRQLRRARLRIFARARNLVDEVHRKTCKFLTATYENILLPQFESSRMVPRGARRIGCKTARQMMTWAHYRFREMLITKASQRVGCHVVICDEAYTSKTCGRCGKIHATLGGAKVFTCPACGFCLGRDVNGARNILLRWMMQPAQQELVQTNVGA